MRLIVFVSAILSVCILSCGRMAHAEDVDSLCARVGQGDAVAGADYVGGVDVYGKAVVPADVGLSGAGRFLNDPIIIPIEMDIIERYGLDLPLGIELRPVIARFEVHLDGRTYYNGFDVTNKINSLCGDREKNQENQTEGHGHESNVAVSSPSVIQAQGTRDDDRIEGRYPLDSVPLPKKKPHYNE